MGLRAPILAFSLAAGLTAPLLAARDGAPPEVVQVDFDEAVQPVSADFLISSLHEAEASGAEIFLVRVNTPGGLVSSTMDVANAFEASAVPVVYFIAPAGAMAASGGFFIALSADVVAAAPGTTLGAASVITIQGGGQEEGGQTATSLKKETEILAAQARSMAKARGRDPEVVQKAIFDAKAWSAEEAREAGLVDVIARDTPQLLAALDGRTVRRFDGSEIVLHTSGYRLVSLEMSWRQRTLSFIARPDILYVLLLIGGAGVLIELYNPGLIVPGVVGGIAFVLFAFGAKVLPVNIVGVLLVIIAAGFFIAEVKITSYGLLTVGGILCLILGGLMLIGEEVPDIPQLHVDPWFIAAIAVPLGLATAWGLSLVARAHRQKVSTGTEGIVGEMGTAATDLDPRGRVYVHGEYWDAEASGNVSTGEAVRVTGSFGLRLRVEPAGAASAPPLPSGSRPQGE